MKKVHINESSFKRLLYEEQNKKELPFQTFYEEMLAFIKGLLNDPIKAQSTSPSETLKAYGLDSKKLREKLCDFDIIKKKEDIREPYDESEGKQKSRYYVSYSVPRDNFKDKLRKLHRSLSSVNENITRDEINMMLNSPLTMGVACDENTPKYVKQATDIYNNKIKKKNRKYEKES